MMDTTSHASHPPTRTSCHRRASEVCDVSILSAEKSEKLADDQFCANTILQENVAKIKEEFSDFVSMSESQIEDLKKENSIKLET